MTVVIPQFAPVVLQGRQVVRNGLYPIASFTHALIDLTNHIARYRPKEVGRIAISLAKRLSYGGSGQRWGFFHSSPLVSKLWTVVTGGGTGATTQTPFIQVQCLTTASVVVGTAKFYFGQGSATNTPAFFSSSGPLALLDPTSGLPAVIPADTDLILNYQGPSGGSLVNAVVYEEAVAADSGAYVDPAVAVLAPIYDVTRQGLATILRGLYRRGSSHLFTFALFNNSTTHPGTTSSATDLNLVDRVSTGAPTIASPGFTLDLSFNAQTRDASLGIHVVMWVLGKCTSAGNGAVKLKSQVAGTVLTAGPFTTALTWVSVAGYLPEVDKHDLQFSTAAGTLEVDAVSLYLQGA